MKITIDEAEYVRNKKAKQPNLLSQTKQLKKAKEKVKEKA